MTLDDHVNELVYFINQEVKEYYKDQYENTSVEDRQIYEVLMFDKYVKENVDYNFNAAKFGIRNYPDAFSEDGFFKKNEDGKSSVVCKSISNVANLVFNKLGIKSVSIMCHFNDNNGLLGGHQWNVISIGDSNYMVDFTSSMVIHNKDKSDVYNYYSSMLFDQEQLDSEYSYLFFDILSSKQSINGFRKDENGRTIDDLDENGNLINITNNPYEVIPNLNTIDKNELLDRLGYDNDEIRKCRY